MSHGEKHHEKYDQHDEKSSCQHDEKLSWNMMKSHHETWWKVIMKHDEKSS
jgi:hypothetical protein